MPQGPDATRTTYVRVRYPFVSEDASMKSPRPLITCALAIALSACGDDVSTPTKPADAVAGDSSSVDIRYAGGLPDRGVPEHFLETFDGSPTSPFRYVPSNWDMSRYVTDGFGFAPMQAMHGADCSAPPATHLARTLADVVFQCKDHVMTAVYTRGYGQAVLTPNRLVDFSAGTAVVAFDVSTLRTAGRDWIDLWITPYDDELQLPDDNDLPDLQGAPRRAVQFSLPVIYGEEGLKPRWTYFEGRRYVDYLNRGVSKIVARWPAAEVYMAADLQFIWSIFYHIKVPGAHTSQNLHNGVFLDGHATHVYISDADIASWGPHVPGKYLPKYGNGWKDARIPVTNGTFGVSPAQKGSIPWSAFDPFGIGPRGQTAG